VLVVGAHGLAGGFGTPREQQRAPSSRKRPGSVSKPDTARSPEPPPALAPTRSAAVREAHMQSIESAVARHGLALCEGLRTRGFGYVDDFVSAADISAMRVECDGMLSRGELSPSESTRWDEEAGKRVAYAKRNVLFTNIAGGAKYESAPHLTEYCVALVSSLPGLVNQAHAHDRRHARTAHPPRACTRTAYAHSERGRAQRTRLQPDAGAALCQGASPQRLATNPGVLRRRAHHPVGRAHEQAGRLPRRRLAL
jgi:hypothetical protein